MTTREQAIKWWNGLKVITKAFTLSKYKDLGLFENTKIETLVEREIEEIWRKETKTTEENIYLNRLKKQYKIFKIWEKDEQGGKIAYFQYQAMRLFCLDTQLLSFNDIELLEFEVNSSF